MSWHVYVGGNFVNVVADGYEEWVKKHSYLAGPLMIAEVNYRASEDYSDTPEQAETYAHLLAAAPELLKALKQAASMPIEDDEDGILDGWLDAIAKAEGRNA